MYEAWCAGYVVGVVDTLNLYDTTGERRICLPQTATGDQVRDIVMRYLTEHPESRHLDGAGGAALALEAAFPCKQ